MRPVWRFFLGLAVTQGQADEYYIYKTAKGELVISNKQPPPGSTIIKQLPGENAPAREPGKPGRGSSILEVTRFQFQRFIIGIKELAEWFGLEVGDCRCAVRIATRGHT